MQASTLARSDSAAPSQAIWLWQYRLGSRFIVLVLARQSIRRSSRPPRMGREQRPGRVRAPGVLS
jgi:hypothetical protein